MKTNNTTPQATTLVDLQTEVWEAYKDAFGFRPRHFTKEDWEDATFLRDTLDICIKEISGECWKAS